MAPISKSLVLAVAFTMLVSTATATMYMDSFKLLVHDPSKNNAIGLVVNQVWCFIMPFLMGPLKLWMFMFWNKIIFPLPIGSDTYELSIPALLQLVGIGNFHQFWFLLMQTMPVIVNNQIAD